MYQSIQLESVCSFLILSICVVIFDGHMIIFDSEIHHLNVLAYITGQPVTSFDMSSPQWFLAHTPVAS